MIALVCHRRGSLAREKETRKPESDIGEALSAELVERGGKKTRVTGGKLRYIRVFIFFILENNGLWRRQWCCRYDVGATGFSRLSF